MVFIALICLAVSVSAEQHFLGARREPSLKMVSELPQGADPQTLAAFYRQIGNAVIVQSGDPQVAAVSVPETFAAHEMSMWTAALISAALTFAFAALYRCMKKPPAVDELQSADLQKWSSSPMDCCEDVEVCCWSTLCPAVRWADSMDMVGQISFWLGVLSFVALSLLSGLLGGGWLLLAFALAMFRQHFRRVFDIDGQGEFSTFCFDCCLYIWCAPCAIAQEARHVEFAAKVNHKAVRKLPEVPSPETMS
eukprot:CAMPEP_0197655218 /NCGR_PEP_ID=MMETSP1338-20131121/39323_1 /TAXON_ID=43686 ORGANISM="Pelagodinium beii, Strain RCC1491" /NCGR_SAMPLE_ID=MMETSP1338 /ASSEMBLY_ACC=CAM_ASM_000754 /LENGTH=250 /DNA_ID=CAMNT_0043230823 /DNA_START=88 /DNA_END=840 /DNA_ORIENTATION=-